MEGDQVEVTGNSCSRGEEYGKKEVLSPTRVVTSSVRVMGGDLEMVPVKTKEDIRKMEVSAPVSIGDVIIPDCAGTGVSIVATRNVEKV